jgi:hypothetical protein
MTSGGWIKGSSASRNIDPGNRGRDMTDLIVAAPAAVACTSRQGETKATRSRPRMIWITGQSRPVGYRPPRPAVLSSAIRGSLMLAIVLRGPCWVDRLEQGPKNGVVLPVAAAAVLGTSAL